MEPITVVLGSVVQLSVDFNKELSAKPVELEMLNGGATIGEQADARADSRRANLTFPAMQSMRFRIRASDTDNFPNASSDEYAIDVRPDRMPTVTIRQPGRDDDRTPSALIPLEVVAEDDFGIESMVLVVDRLGDKMHKEITLTNLMEPITVRGDMRRFLVKYAWDLARLDEQPLKPGDIVEYCVRVRDNFELNGQRHDPVNSAKFKIRIISQDTLADQTRQAIQRLSERVKQTQNAQTSNKTQTEGLRKDMESRPVPDAGDRKQLNRLHEQQSGLASQTKHVADEMADIEKRLDENRSDNGELKDIAKDVRTTLNEAAEKPMTQAANKLSEASQLSDPKAAKSDPNAQKQQGEQRKGAMEASENKQKEAADKLADALNKMGNAGTLENAIAQVRKALDDQRAATKKLEDIGKQTLGKEVDKLTPQEKKALTDAANEQKKQAENTDKMTKQLDKAADQMQKSDPASSQAMKQAAQQSQQKQVSSNQSQAAQNAQQNQQAQARANQTEAEIGLQTMLDTLRQAERRKLEQLSKELAKLQELVNNLVRRQAGHNIDNLRIQGGDKLKQITDELVLKSERDRKKMPPAPEPEKLTGSQGQTESNTRDVSKTAEVLQRGGAEIAAILTRAAGSMERATISLKEEQLPPAYDPHQVKALEALDEAKKKTDQAAADLQDQLDQANRETLRQAFERIRGDQAKVNDETVRLDGAPKGADGTLKRENAVKLGGLPGQQGAVADAAKKLDDALRDLGGYVYSWANKDIVNNMGEVKTQLAKPETGAVVQADQKLILEQLDAMIRNLAIKPPKPSEFHQPPGGGGGGGGSPKPRLPSEVELRLLRNLQKARVNRDTTALAQKQPADKPELVKVGTRQGAFRKLLDNLIQGASRGMIKLDPEPDPKQRLPEEATDQDIADQEFQQWLLGNKGGDDQLANEIKEVGQRMARSRQRLALDHDPGKTTQKIQERILTNLDHLIQMAQKQQQQQMASGKPQPGQQPGQQPQQGQQQVGQGQPQPNKSTTPAGSERFPGQGDNTADTSKDIREKVSEWGLLTPKERQAVLDGMRDRPVRKYLQLVDDYFQAMNKKASKAGE